MEFINLIFEMSQFFQSRQFRLFQRFITYFFFRTKKLLEFPVERDFPKENAFSAVPDPFLFQLFLRIRFFDAEVRFFGTDI
uniref:Ribosomal protein L32 n=1 Tax=Syringa reticulata subsp. amurensis TaxID=149021 RepID=A0A8A0WS06_9LAMI|nr:ribosomal protein L32 [Syringa reticulata subsp. amurensis]